MRVQQLADRVVEYEPSSLSLGFKRLRPLAPKLAGTGTETNVKTLDVKSLIENSRQQANHLQANCITCHSDASPLVELLQQHGGTRWNPTQEQIETLEKLYKGGMRTPNAQQIERITGELGKHGKIEGKNVFYWFQNHKARERQKQKRSLVAALNNNNFSSLPITTSKEEAGKDNYSNVRCKRRCQSWSVGFEESEIGDGGGGGGEKTLELFPLHPEGR